jgi:hypothetical protein
VISRRYAPWLWLLLGLFALRVIAQPMALVVPVWFLPPFESWYSGVLPYGILLSAQILIIAWLAWTAWRFSTGDVTPRSRVGRVGLALGGLYFGSMVLRLFLGATVLRGQRWFASPVPTVFHLVLASYLLLFGHFHFRYAADRRKL